MKCPLLCTQGGGHFTIYGVPFFVDSIKAGLLAADCSLLLHSFELKSAPMAEPLISMMRLLGV
ncbi:MAG TPA: hypothetical protein DGU45_07330 [Planctomycetes bacterium]|nr:hypothetical protein [Planctomycetota bacterium]